ncbi:MAG: hypothetical protein QM765_18100 [Myxococcales bacterium]
MLDSSTPAAIAVFLASPKSSSLTKSSRPSRTVSRTFSDLTSRCSTSREWVAASAEATCIRMGRAWASRIGPPAARRWSVSPSRYSMRMQGRPSGSETKS